MFTLFRQSSRLTGPVVCSIFAANLFFHTDRNSMYWWELVVLLRKYFIITASTFVVSDTNQLQMTFGIVLAALLLHITNHPFERDTQAGATLQLYEMMSLLVLSVVIWCGQYFTNSPGMCETTHEGTCTFMIISIFLINFVYMLLLFIKCGSHWWKRKRVASGLRRTVPASSQTPLVAANNRYPMQRQEDWHDLCSAGDNRG